MRDRLDNGNSANLSNSDRPLVAVTGATGILGSALVPHLVRAYPSHQIVLLTRTPQAPCTASAVPLRADITRDDLGLDPETYRQLQTRVTLFVHCAADTRFNLPIEQARLVNTEGTRRILHFTRGCTRLEQLAHLSTLYIAGRRPGLVTENSLRHGYGYVNTYERSKHEAEELVLEAARDLPVAVYRLSSVIDTRGARGHVHQILRLLPRSAQFPLIPAAPDVPVDLITAEWAALVLNVLIGKHFRPGLIRHICAGPVRSLTVTELMEIVFAAYDECMQGASPRPQLVSLPEFDLLRGGCGGSGTTLKAMATLLTFLPHLAIPQPFDPGMTASLLACHDLAPPDIRSTISQLVANEFRPAAGPQGGHPHANGSENNTHSTVGFDSRSRGPGSRGLGRYPARVRVVGSPSRL